MRRFFHLAAALLLSAIFLGTLAKPAVANTTGYLSLINTYRQQNNLGTLSEDQNLTNSACWFAADMGVKNYFPSDHVDSLGRDMATRLAAFEVTDGTRGENIFYTTQGSDANYAFTAWKNSPGHNANMLNSAYTRIGIGQANYSSKWYWVTDFASGTAIGLDNQCGVAVNPPTPPKPAPSPKPTSPPTPIPVAVVEQPTNQIIIATPSASVQNPATASASTSAKVVEIPTPNPPAGGLVKSSFLVGGLFGYLALFGFIFWRLFHFHRLPKKIKLSKEKTV